MILTTFETVRKEWEAFTNVLSAREALDDGTLDRRLPQRGYYALMVLLYSAMFIDEVSRVSRQSSLTSQAICAIDAKKRFGFTGNPLENDYTELQTLTKSLRIGPWDNTDDFNQVCV